MGLIILEIVLVIWLVKRLKSKPRYHPKQNKTYTIPTSWNNIGYAMEYQTVPLLTAREQREYQKLRFYAQQADVLICPKVRLLDLVTPKPGCRNYKALLSKVMSKHVDFVICDHDMKVLGIIELDDTTHLRKDRMERDEFVDAVLKGSGYKIVHTWEIKKEDLDQIMGVGAPEIQAVKIISPTGWIWNENTKLWEPPPNLKS